MKSIIIALLITMLFISCSNNQIDNQNFIRIADNFIENYLKIHPEWATGLGDHRYDHLLDGYDNDAIQKELQFLTSFQDSMKMIAAENLDQVNLIDFKILKFNIEKRIFNLTFLKSHESNPLHYNIGGSIYSLLARDFAPLEKRLENLKQRLAQIPTVLEAARQNLKNPPKIHTETAILQNKGNISLITRELNSFLEGSPELRESFAPVQRTAVTALEQYGEWLEDELLPRSNGEFRLGDDLFRKKLYYTLETDFSKEEILEVAIKDLKETQEAMYQTALPMYKKVNNDASEDQLNDRKHVIKSVLDHLAEKHPDNNTIVDLAKKSLQSCIEFVQAQSLVTMPQEPLEIIVMPEFQRGVAVAYCDAPGALEEKGQTFYAISPTPEDWTEERVKSFFREYNNYMLEDLTVHEAVPGHYLQLMHANAFKAPTNIRAIFASGTFIEGWATYSEQIMVEAGYIGPELKMQQLKMRLRLIINAIIDQKIHTEGMTEEQAITLMMDEGFQEEGEASGKWRRACLTSTQLSTYFVGNLEINDIRSRYEEKYGQGKTLLKMHDRMLSFGSPAPKYVKELLEL